MTAPRLHKCAATVIRTAASGLSERKPCSDLGKVRRNGKWWCERHDPAARNPHPITEKRHVAG